MTSLRDNSSPTVYTEYTFGTTVVLHEVPQKAFMLILFKFPASAHRAVVLCFPRVPFQYYIQNSTCTSHSVFFSFDFFISFIIRIRSCLAHANPGFNTPPSPSGVEFPSSPVTVAPDVVVSAGVVVRLFLAETYS